METWIMTVAAVWVWAPATLHSVQVTQAALPNNISSCHSSAVQRKAAQRLNSALGFADAAALDHGNGRRYRCCV